MKFQDVTRAAVLFMVFIMGCTTQKVLPEIRLENFAANAGEASKNEYRIKSGDKLLITNLNWSSLLFPDMTKIQETQTTNKGYTASVHKDGNITLPEIGKIHVAGLSRQNLADSLAFRYKDILREPIFEVEITNLRVKVLGAATIQGVVALDKETQTLGEVLAKAGGIKFNEAGNKIQIIHEDGKQQNIIEYDFQQLGNPLIMNLPVYDGDIIYVPPSKEALRSVKLSRKLLVIQPIFIALNLAILVINLTK